MTRDQRLSIHQLIGAIASSNALSLSGSSFRHSGDTLFQRMGDLHLYWRKTLLMRH